MQKVFNIILLMNLVDVGFEVMDCFKCPPTNDLSPEEMERIEMEAIRLLQMHRHHFSDKNHETTYAIHLRGSISPFQALNDMPDFTINDLVFNIGH